MTISGNTFVVNLNQTYKTPSKMAKPVTYTADLENESSASFNRRLEEIKDVKATAEEKERIFSLVDRVLANADPELR
jgi:hypothetical protein